MKKIALFVTAIAVSIIISACVEKVGIHSKDGAFITLSDNTIIFCKEWIFLESLQPGGNLTVVRCTNDRGLHLRIPPEQVVKIEIRGGISIK